MNHRHHKMHGGEIAFHIAVPLIIFSATAAMGYYVVMLVMNILRVS